MRPSTLPFGSYKQVMDSALVADVSWRVAYAIRGRVLFGPSSLQWLTSLYQGDEGGLTEVNIRNTGRGEAQDAQLYLHEDGTYELLRLGKADSYGQGSVVGLGDLKPQDEATVRFWSGHPYGRYSWHPIKLVARNAVGRICLVREATGAAAWLAENSYALTAVCWFVLLPMGLIVLMLLLGTLIERIRLSRQTREERG